MNKLVNAELSECVFALIKFPLLHSSFKAVTISVGWGCGAWGSPFPRLCAVFSVLLLCAGCAGLCLRGFWAAPLFCCLWVVGDSSPGPDYLLLVEGLAGLDGFRWALREIQCSDGGLLHDTGPTHQHHL